MKTIRPRKCVSKFAHIMEERLRKNSWKGGWHSMDERQLLARLREEAAELQFAAFDHPNINTTAEEIKQIAKEAADVANFAMMIADNCGGLK